ncbi:MAG: hypothetical protein AAGF92_17555 [Myxococcota bacterium]
MKKSVVWMALLAVLVATAACKKEKPAETAATATPLDTVTVLDAGQEPRLPLRYRIPEGATTSSTSTFRVVTLAESSDAEAVSVLPGLRLNVVSGPAAITEQGVRFDVDVVKSAAVVPPDLDEAIAADLQASARILDEVGAWVEMDDRGKRIAGELNEAAKRPDIPKRLLRMIINARTTVTRVQLPEEPVGLGARWQVRRELDVFGFKVTQVDTYQLVDRAGDELMLNLWVQQNGLPQTISFPEEGIEIGVESMKSEATGQITLNLDALESDAEAHGKSNDKIRFKTPDGTDSVEIQEVFDLQVANTTKLMPNVPAK